MSATLWRQLVGEVIDNRYYLREFRGAGRFGGVFLASEVVADRQIPRQLAVKLIPLESAADTDGQMREVLALASLEHRNILRYYGSGLCALQNGTSCLYIVTELAEESLRQRIERGALTDTEARTLIEDLLSGLAYMHQPPASRVHRDLKPENILRVGRDWKIADLGLVRDVGGISAQRTTQPMGAPAYAPPEAYQGNRVSTAWDMWSLGVIVVEAVTRSHPFGDVNNAAGLLNSVITKEPIIPSSMDEPFRQIALGCLVKDAANRWTAQRSLDALQGRASPTAHARSRRARLPHRLREETWLPY